MSTPNVTPVEEKTKTADAPAMVIIDQSKLFGMGGSSRELIESTSAVLSSDVKSEKFKKNAEYLLLAFDDKSLPAEVKIKFVSPAVELSIKEILALASQAKDVYEALRRFDIARGQAKSENVTPKEKARITLPMA